MYLYDEFKVLIITIGGIYSSEYFGVISEEFDSVDPPYQTAISTNFYNDTVSLPRSARV